MYNILFTYYMTKTTQGKKGLKIKINIVKYIAQNIVEYVKINNNRQCTDNSGISHVRSAMFETTHAVMRNYNFSVQNGHRNV